MKRLALSLGLLVIATVAGVAGVVAFRPDLLPPWARAGTPTKGSEAPLAAGLFCKEHGVPEKFCTLCHPELARSLMLCSEHGDIPEDICTLCHDDVEMAYGLVMCPKGHGLPEHFCVMCGKGTAAASPDDGWCAEHAQPEATCAECLANPKSGDEASGISAARVCRQPLPLVRLANARLADEIGLTSARATLETHGHILEANAESAFDANAYADVVPRVAGILREIKADLGKAVAQGDVLAIVDSPEVSGAKSRYLTAQAALTLARAAYERTKALARQDALPAKQELEALTALSQSESASLDAAQALKNLGFDGTALEGIVQSKDLSSELRIVAPIGGTVIQRHAVTGEAVVAATSIFTIANRSRMWLWIDVYESDVDKIEVGQPLTFHVPGQNGPTYQGNVTWVGAQVDEATRTTQVRAELENPAGRLRANQFGQAMIEVGVPHDVIVVPKGAVQSHNGVSVVFLPVEPGVYRPQRVMARPSNRPDVVEIDWGLQAGDEVVTSGSFWLKTEIMKGEIGAGCCE